MEGQPAGSFDTRLAVTGGLLVLSEPGVKDLKCGMLDVGERGCRCSALGSDAAAEDRAAWRPLLQTGRQFVARLAFPPHLLGAQVTARVEQTTVFGREGGIELKLAFVEVDSNNRQLLERAILALATQKIKTRQTLMLTPGTRPGPAVPKPVAARGTLAAAAVPPPPPPPPVQAAGGNPALRGLRLGEILVKMGIVDAARMDAAVRAARDAAQPLGRYLVLQRLATGAQVCHALSLKSGIPMIKLDQQSQPPGALKLFSPLLLARHRCVPFEIAPDRIRLALANPLPLSVLEDLRIRCGRTLEVFLAEEDLIQNWLDRLPTQMSSGRRQYPRYPVELAVALKFRRADGTPASVVVHSGRSRDVSLGGFRVVTPAPNLGAPDEVQSQRVGVEVSVLTGDPFSAVCDIRSIAVEQDSAGREVWMFGLQIGQITTGDLVRLRELCRRVARDQKMIAELL